MLRCKWVFRFVVICGLLSCGFFATCHAQDSKSEQLAGEQLTNDPTDGLAVHWEDRYLEIRGESIPGGPVRIHYLEAYCRPGSTDRDWSETVISHESELLQNGADGRCIHLRDTLEDGVVVEHIIEANVDSVEFRLTASNPTGKDSVVSWAQPCMRVDKFTGTSVDDSRKRFPPYIENCFLLVDGKLTRLPTEPWATEARYVPGQVYVPHDVDRKDVNPRPLSTVVPSHSLTGCFSADEKMILAVAWEPYQEIFQGVITCMHNDFRIGGLKAGETKSIRGKVYIVPANADKLVSRFLRDFGHTNESPD